MMCFFTPYRFSEDLDFSLDGFWLESQMMDTLAAVQQWSAVAKGPDFNALSPHLEVVNDDYGSEVYQVRIYYRGPLSWGGSPRSIRLDISRGEYLAFLPARRSLLHPYSDAPFIAPEFVFSL